MSRYLDPKADLTFKRVFGEHPDLLISFLNAMLPFDKEEEYVKEIEYLPTELVPDNPLRKDSIVDVRCKDGLGRQFLVEMQMLWSSEFTQRVLFNASKAYVRQLGKKENYHLLQPVYSINIVNEEFMSELPDEHYHYFRMVHSAHDNIVINGLHLVFIELPKFKPRNFSEKRMQVLWLRYLTEIDETTSTVSDDLLADSNIRKAIDQLEESAYNEEQMYAYDRFWDMVRVENGLLYSAERKGLEEGIEKGMARGMKKGMAKGRAEGLAEGRAEEKRSMARNLKAAGVDIAIIAQSSGLSVDEIEKL